MVKWTILVIGNTALPDATRAYFEKHRLPYIIHSGALFDTQQVHRILPGYDFILIWASHVFPTPLLTSSIVDELNFTKVNVAWDSYGRNYPHETAERFSHDLMGIPAVPTHEIHWLPKDLNVSDGYFESGTARLRNVPQKPTPTKCLARCYNPLSGRYD